MLILLIIMRKIFRQIAAILVLFIFAFPFVQKEVHTFEHAHDFECTSKTERHYHEEIHHCYICDYKILLASPSEEFSQSVDFVIINSDVISFYKSAFIANHSFSFALRAPPFVT